MLAVSPLRGTNYKGEGQNEMESFSFVDVDEDFVQFLGDKLLDTIDFDDLFVGINDGDVLPDLEMDSEILVDFSGAEESAETINASSVSEDNNNNNNNNNSDEEEGKNSRGSSSEDVVSKANDDDDEDNNQVDKVGNSSTNKEGVEKKGSKKISSKQSKNAQGKRKVKVDWTPDLHRRFVQAVEQLGVDKAVPSRILELMGIDRLTRHNIASHLQKYRSHRKHLLAREAEAASWNQRHQMYGGGGGAVVAHGGCKRELNPWAAPTIGFPPVAPMPHVRHLHVSGHPSADQSLMHMWPKHVATAMAALSSPPLPPVWAPHPPPQPPGDHASFWHSHHHRAPNSLTPGTPACFAPPMAAARFPAPPVPGVPPPPTTMYKVEPPALGVPTTPLGQTLPKPPVDFQPSKESIDAAIGDVISKPWLPLPLGLKPPCVDSVLGELQRQGVSKISPTAYTTALH